MTEIVTIDVVADPVNEPPIISKSPDERNPSSSDPRPPLPMVHSILDEYGLTVHEFRIYCHIVRRTGGKLDKECFAKQKTMAALCQICLSKVKQALAVLSEAGFLEKLPRKGKTDIYKLTPMAQWKSRNELTAIREKTKPKAKAKNNKEDDDNYELDF